MLRGRFIGQIICENRNQSRKELFWHCFLEEGDVRLLYWIRKTILRDRHCGSCCMVCCYYEICINDWEVETNE